MSEPYIYTDDPNYGTCPTCRNDRVLNPLDGLCTQCRNHGFSEESMSPATLPTTWQDAMEQADVDFHAEGGTE